MQLGPVTNQFPVIKRQLESDTHLHRKSGPIIRKKWWQSCVYSSPTWEWTWAWGIMKTTPLTSWNQLMEPALVTVVCQYMSVAMVITVVLDSQVKKTHAYRLVIDEANVELWRNTIKIFLGVLRVPVNRGVAGDGGTCFLGNFFFRYYAR